MRADGVLHGVLKPLDLSNEFLFLLRGKRGGLVASLKLSNLSLDLNRVLHVLVVREVLENLLAFELNGLDLVSDKVLFIEKNSLLITESLDLLDLLVQEISVCELRPRNLAALASLLLLQRERVDFVANDLDFTI